MEEMSVLMFYLQTFGPNDSVHFEFRSTGTANTNEASDRPSWSYPNKTVDLIPCAYDIYILLYVISNALYL